MYLKSLILKGFKSFADKTVLNLEPGITAIVGPNGSGKSNISDAVLWVLGERSARNLRGQSMEDIIFSGSAARKAVSVAEVELVLDNSDGTLPVEFDEVSITRRMYRSGESEYLVNGVVSRRLDVLDILHDTGLGTGTHSIISQGSLDSILQSKPEDRRALIEEAAGVLKHKQRKEKSARKLAAMDNHLMRVRDVAGEVSRQLGPLERKAKRAEAYKEVSAQLKDVRLALAVDDLRGLQAKWDAVCSAEKEAAGAVEEQRSAVAQAERRVSDVQELMRRESDGANELARKQRRAANLVERLDGAEMLLRERRRAAVAFDADLRSALDASEASLGQLQAELEQARANLKETADALESAASQSQETATRKGALEERLRQLRQAIDDAAAQLLDCEHRSDEAKGRRDLLQERLADGLAQQRLVEGRKQEVAAELERARQAAADAREAREQAEAKLKGLEERHGQLQQLLAERFNGKERAQAHRDECHGAAASARSRIEAIEEAIRTHMQEDPALSWLLENAPETAGELVPLSSGLKVEGSLEWLVEALLGDDLGTLTIADRDEACAIARCLRESAQPGDVSLAVRAVAAADADPTDGPGEALASLLRYPDSLAPTVASLLGDVRVADTLEEAFAFQGQGSAARYLTRDGCVLWPSGKVRVLGQRDGADEGVLARERRLDEAKAELGRKEAALADAEAALADAEAAYRETQGESLALSQELATHRGVCEAAAKEDERAAQHEQEAADEVRKVQELIASAQVAVDELRPQMEEMDALLQELSGDRARLLAEREERSQALEPLRREAAEVGESYNELRLQEAKLAERKAYAERMADTRQRNIESVTEELAQGRESLKAKAVAVLRGAELLEVFERIAAGLARSADGLSAALDASESSAHSAHADAASAQDAARRAHDSYDQANSRMAQVQVEKSRLEVQVEAAVSTVTRDCATPLEVAEQLPRLEDRRGAEDECYRLERRIRNMGSINPDAAEEYAALKERYDYLAGQLEDIEAARRALNRIVRVIDARMRDDFARTFEMVNRSFNEIFSVLFPGGSAELTLVDPDDIENSGVEVKAQPRGKRLTKMMLMSGGEKSLTALALLFAVYRTRTTPFYILDEVEAALDDTNLRRLISYIDTLRDTTQLIMITHQRRTMEMADVLFGVSMQADGVTQVISQKLERALQHAQEE